MNLTRVEITGNGGAAGHGTRFYLTRVLVDDPDITDNMTIKQAMDAKGVPGFMTTDNTIRIRVTNRNHATGDMYDVPLPESPIGKSSDNFVAYMNTLPPTMVYNRISYTRNSTNCVTLTRGTKHSAKPFSHSGNWHGMGVSSRECDFRTPEPNEWCAPTSPSVSLDYGSRPAADALGTTVATEINVECSADSTYSLRLQGDPTGLPLNNGMTATLTTDGKPAGSTLNGIKGTNTVRLESTLSGDPVRTGPFNGEGVLFIQYN
jgi:hypothetical protein